MEPVGRGDEGHTVTTALPKSKRGGTPGNKGNPSPVARVATGKAMVQVQGFRAPADLASWFNALQPTQKRAVLQLAKEREHVGELRAAIAEISRG